MNEEKQNGKTNHLLNLTGVMCPINFVKTKLKLEEMEDGQNLEVIIDDGKSMQSVPLSLKEEGHKITKVEKLSDGSYKLLVRKGGLKHGR